MNEYDLTFPYNITSAVWQTSFSVAAGDGNPVGLAFNNDGSRMYVLGFEGTEVNQYVLSTPFSVNTSSYGATFSLSSELSSPTGFTFSKDGSKMYVVSSSSRAIYEYVLSIPFEVNTASYTSRYFYVNEESAPRGIAFDDTGTILGLVGSINDQAYRYDLSATAFTENPANDGSVNGSLIVSITNDLFINPGGTIAVVDDYTVDNLPAGLVPSMNIGVDGLTATLTLGGNASASEDANDLGDISFSFTDNAFQSHNVAAIDNAVSASSNLGIEFNNELLASYPFSGNANDETGNGQNGIVNGAVPTSDRFGNSNSAFSFDGVDDYIEIPDFDPTGGSNYITVSWWANPRSTTGPLKYMFYLGKHSSYNRCREC